jgi:hypothetical protein
MAKAVNILERDMRIAKSRLIPHAAYRAATQCLRDVLIQPPDKITFTGVI